MFAKSSLTIGAACAALLTGALAAPAAEPPPLKALLIAGGCCHDYAKQKDLLKRGLEARANLKVDVMYVEDGSTSPKLPILGNPDYAQGYDVVIHDECGADLNDKAIVEAVLKPHRDGIPGVNLHCAVHSYRIGDPASRPPTARPTPFGLSTSASNPA